MAQNATKEPRKSALTKALENPKGKERPVVYKGIYIYADQYIELEERRAYNKIHGIYPTNASEMIREALDAYLEL